jgi:hypothetical protein
LDRIHGLSKQQARFGYLPFRAQGRRADGTRSVPATLIAQGDLAVFQIVISGSMR